MSDELQRNPSSKYSNSRSNHKTTVKSMKNTELPLTQISNILVPTDFSDNSANAVHLAVSIAERSNATILAVHACHMPYADEHMPPTMVQELINAQQLRSEEQMSAFMAKYQSKFDGYKINTKVVLGFAAETILDTAKHNNTDLIVIGTQGANSMEDRLFGTVTWNIIKRSNIPVIAVPQSAEDIKFKNIMIPFEGTDYDNDIITYLLKFAEKYNAIVHGVHFIQDASTYNKGAIDKLQNRFRKELEAETLQLHFPAEKNITEGIKKFATRNNVDMICMVTHNQGLFSTIFHMSVTRNIALYSQIPLLAYNMDKVDYKAK
jgi:nucleotide-binding universal stress UspA family protein